MRITGIGIHPEESFRVFIKCVKTIAGANPKSSLVVLRDRIDAIATDGEWVVNIRAIYCKIVTIVFIQTINGAEPQKSIAILKYIHASAARESFGGGKIFKFQVGVLGLRMYAQQEYKRNAGQPFWCSGFVY